MDAEVAADPRERLREQAANAKDSDEARRILEDAALLGMDSLEADHLINLLKKALGSKVTKRSLQQAWRSARKEAERERRPDRLPRQPRLQKTDNRRADFASPTVGCVGMATRAGRQFAHRSR
jgi:hypothetical protein